MHVYTFVQVDAKALIDEECGKLGFYTQMVRPGEG